MISSLAFPTPLCPMTVSTGSLNKPKITDSPKGHTTYYPPITSSGKGTRPSNKLAKPPPKKTTEEKRRFKLPKSSR